MGIGRGFGKREDVALGEQLAAALEAELGCTKGLSDFQWVSEERIVGLSGAKTKPDLYVAVGISGQIQHTVGISSSKLIVAVNTGQRRPDLPAGRLRHRGRPLRGGARRCIEKLESL